MLWETPCAAAPEGRKTAFTTKDGSHPGATPGASGEPGNRCSGGVSGGGGPPRTGTDRGQPREVWRAGQPALGAGARTRWGHRRRAPTPGQPAERPDGRATGTEDGRTAAV